MTWQPASGNPNGNPAQPQPQGTNASGGPAPAQSDGAPATVNIPIIQSDSYQIARPMPCTIKNPA